MIKWNENTLYAAEIIFMQDKEDNYKELGVSKEQAYLFDGKYASIFQTVKDGMLTVFVGMGEVEKLDTHKIKNIAAKAARVVTALNVTNFAVDISNLLAVVGEKAYNDVILGIELSLYKYTGIHQKNEEKEFFVSIKDFNIQPEHSKVLIDEALSLAQGMLVARDWVNTPGNYLTPEIFAQSIKAKLLDTACTVKILDEKEIADLKMGTFLAVGASSYNKPRLIVIKYIGDPDSEKVYGYIGKGVTLDTGGYTLKTAQGLIYTKGDMGGAAAVAGAMYAIAKNNLKVNITAVIPACENRLSEESHIPGDVVTSMNGKTVEILNTDAEGRLILSDAITYAVREENVTHLIDIATLTGAIVNALGTVAAGCMTNDQEYLNSFFAVNAAAGEKYWQMPAFEEYEELLKSKVADIKNVGGPTAGSIVAGLFLKEFVENTPWIHLDIAGTSQTESPLYEYQCFGGTGAGVPSLYFLAKSNQKQ